MTINRPKFYNLQSHLLPRKTYCATIFGNCFPSVNGPPQYTLEYNIELVRFFYTCIENIAALLNDNDLAYKYINFSQNNKLLEEYELEQETIKTKKAQFKYNKVSLDDTPIVFEDFTDNVDELIDIIKDSQSELDGLVMETMNRYDLENASNKNQFELLFRINKMYYLYYKINVHFVIWKRGLINIEDEWKGWLTWEWRHLDYINENTFLYYVSQGIEDFDEENIYKSMLEKNKKTIDKVLEDKKTQIKKLKGQDKNDDKFSSILIIQLELQQQFFNKLITYFDKWNVEHQKDIKKPNYTLPITFGISMLCLIFSNLK